MGFWTSAKDSLVAKRLDDERLYATALREIEAGVRRDGLWAQAVGDSKGDQRAAQSVYLRLRVQSLRDEEYASHRAAEYSAVQERRAIESSERGKQQQYAEAMEREWSALLDARRGMAGSYVIPLLGGLLFAIGAYAAVGLPRDSIAAFALMFGAFGVGVVLGMFVYRYLPGQRRFRQVERMREEVKRWR